MADVVFTGKLAEESGRARHGAHRSPETHPEMVTILTS
jgi:hypothetical protein